MTTEGKRDRFDKFTERAKTALVYADEERERLGNPSTTTDHIALGIARVRDGLAAKILSNLGVKVDNFYSELVSNIPKGSARLRLKEKQLSNDAQRGIELSVEEAMKLKHHYIGTEHLLLGLSRTGSENPQNKSAAVRVLEGFGVNYDKILEETKSILTSPSLRPSRSETDIFEPIIALPENNPDVIMVLHGWNMFLKDPSMADEAREKYVEMLTSLLEKEVKEYKEQQNNQQPS